MESKVTVLEYYKGYWSLYAFGAGIGFLPPLIHELLGNSSTTANLLYPPLGDMQRLGLVLTFGFLLLTTFVVFVCCRSARRIHVFVPALLLAAVLVGVGGLTYLYVHYVRVDRIETKNLSVPVTIGYERTKFAIDTYPNDGDPKHDDWTMLHERGPTEDKIQQLWTRQSIWAVRYSLWACYTLTLGSLLAMFSLGVYLHVSEKRSEVAS
jgi:hypothetical protein